MAIAEIISFIASIGACLSGIGAILVVISISKQIKASHRPDLIIPRITFQSSDNDRMDSFPTLWTSFKKEHVEDTINKSFSIPIYNIGLGAAKCIIIKIDFPFENLKDDVIEKLELIKSQININYNKKNLNVNSKTYNFSHGLPLNNSAIVDYVLPSSVDEKGTELFIPSIYIMFVSFLVCANRIMKVPFRKFNIPKLQIKIEYMDISGKRYKTNFELAIRISYISINNDIHGYIVNI